MSETHAAHPSGKPVRRKLAILPRQCACKPGLGLPPHTLTFLVFSALARTFCLSFAADLRTLAALIPERAHMVLDAGGDAAAAATAAAQTVSVPTASVAPGDMLRVLPGERMPVDGVVLAGKAVADEAMLTGEAALVAKTPGDQVNTTSIPGLTLQQATAQTIAPDTARLSVDQMDASC